MKLLSVTLLTAALTAAMPIPASTGRPLVTEDADVLALGECEVEGALLRGSAEGTTANERTFQFGCGIGRSTQLALNVATIKSGGLRERGVALLGKTSVWNNDAGAALSVAWGLTWDRAAGDPWQHTGGQLNLAYSRPTFADMTLHANLGHSRDRVANERSTSWGLAVEHEGFAGLAPMAELFGDDRSAPWWNLGLRWAPVSDRLFVDASYGRQISAGKPTLVTLGFKVAF